MPDEKKANTLKPPEYNLDITGDTCPITFVRAKLYLERMSEGELLTIHLREGEPLHNVPRSLKEHGHRIVRLERTNDDIFELVVARGPERKR